MATIELSEPGHVPVLPKQVLALLAPRSGQNCLDCTIGRGGHACLIAPRLAPGGRYVGLDADPANADYCRDRLRQMGLKNVSLTVEQANFADAADLLTHLGMERTDLLLADLGFASNQMNDPSRGLSFTTNGPLDMRFDPSAGRPATDLVNQLGEHELADLIFQFGEERRSRKIARNIVEQRRQSPIKTTWDLARIVHQAFGGRARSTVRHRNSPDHVNGGTEAKGRPVRDIRGRRWRGRIDPATRTFMALRIAVNAELDALRKLLDRLPNLVAPQGVVVFISFHSLEDRLVKQAFVRYEKDGKAQRLTPKPLLADENERRDNPRSRSAKLRAIRWS